MRQRHSTLHPQTPPQTKPASILRRSSTASTVGESKGNKTYRSASTTNTESNYDSEGASNNIFPDNANDDYLESPITDVNELADRILKFKHSYSPSTPISPAVGYNIANQSQPHATMSGGGGYQHLPFQSPAQNPRPSSLGRLRSRIEAEGQRNRRSSEKSWSIADEDEYVRKMAGIKLDQKDLSFRGSASSSEYLSESFNREMNASCNSFFTDQVRGRGRDRMRRDYNDAASTKSPNDMPRRKSSQSRERRGRSKSTTRVPIDPMADELDDHNLMRDRDRARSGDYADAASTRSSNMLRRNSSRSRDRARSKSASRRAAVDPILEQPAGDISSAGNDRMIRAKSVEQLHHLSDNEERLRRSRSRSPFKSAGTDVQANKRSTSSSRGGMSFTRALGAIRDKLIPNTPPSVSPSKEASSRRHRSRSRNGRRLSAKEGSMGDEMSPGKSLRSIDKVKRASSRDKSSKMSASTGRRSSQSQASLGNNRFVDESSKVKFDKKTGRCKKHPSIILAKKSAFRSNSWEIIKQNGCPYCAEEKEKVDSDYRLDEDLESHWSKKSEARTAFPSKSGNSAPSNQQVVIDSIPQELRSKKVSRILYTTPLGETGWYTGDVDSEGNPHGYGRMRYKTGHTYEGDWNHGYGENHLENLSRMKGGFGSNKAAWQKSETAPSVRRAAVQSPRVKRLG